MTNPLDKAYVDWKSWQRADFGRPTAASCAYFSKLWTTFIGGSRTPYRVLEIGFGNGQFLGWCQQQGQAVAGVETNGELLACARQAGFDSHASLTELSDKGFDLIVLFDVIEHLPETELPAYLRMLKHRLAENGQIILRTPNGGSPFGLNNQHGDPTHTAILTRNKLKYLAHGAGLRVHYCGKDIYPLYSGRLHSLPGRLLRCVLSRGLEALIRFAFAPQPPGILSANLLTVLRIAKVSDAGASDMVAQANKGAQ